MTSRFGFRLVTSWVPREHVSDTVKAAFVQGRLTKDELEALATGADPLHLALVFNIDHTNAMACRQRRPQPSQRPSRMVCGRASQVPLGVAVPQWQAAEVWCNGTSQAPERGLGTLVKLRWERGGPWWSAGSG